MKCVLLFARPYSFKDEKSGREQAGMSLSYLSTDKLSPNKDEAGGFYGYQPIKDSVSYDLFPKIVTVPGIYDVEVTVKPGADGRAVMRIVDLEFVGGLPPIEQKPVTK